MSAIVFLLIVISALFHAGWNFAAKKAAGNFHVIYLSLFVVIIFFFPLLLFLPVKEVFGVKACLCVFSTGAIHAAYFFFLAKAYEYGEISTAYPIARGTGIAGTALAAYLFLNEHVSLIGSLGILSVSAGTILIGIRFSFHKEHYKGIFLALLVGSTIIGYSIVDKVGAGLLNPVY